jgi:hypothetical protein
MTRYAWLGGSSWNELSYTCSKERDLCIRYQDLAIYRVDYLRLVSIPGYRQKLAFTLPRQRSRNRLKVRDSPQIWYSVTNVRYQTGSHHQTRTTCRSAEMRRRGVLGRRRLGTCSRETFLTPLFSTLDDDNKCISGERWRVEWQAMTMNVLRL